MTIFLFYTYPLFPPPFFFFNHQRATVEITAPQRHQSVTLPIVLLVPSALRWTTRLPVCVAPTNKGVGTAVKVKINVELLISHPAFYQPAKVWSQL